MRTIIMSCFCLLLLALGTRSAAAAPADPTGYWVTGKNQGVVQIYRCGADTLCGALVGFPMDDPSQPLPQTWDHRPQCRFVFIRDLHPRVHSWLGRIINPQSGQAYGAKVRLMSQNQMRLRGYFLLPILGATRFWSRYTGPTPPEDCRMPPHSLG
jgi:uncharacterized protein (DUF2147 family)